MVKSSFLRRHCPSTNYKNSFIHVELSILFAVQMHENFRDLAANVFCEINYLINAHDIKSLTFIKTVRYTRVPFYYSKDILFYVNSKENLGYFLFGILYPISLIFYIHIYVYLIISTINLSN